MSVNNYKLIWIIFLSYLRSLYVIVFLPTSNWIYIYSYKYCNISWLCHSSCCYSTSSWCYFDFSSALDLVLHNMLVYRKSQKSLCTYCRRWVQKSPCTLIHMHFSYHLSYTKCWEWPPRACRHASTHDNLFANTCDSSIGGMFLMQFAIASSVQGECEDCLCKLRLPSPLTDDKPGGVRSGSVASWQKQLCV
jgi:hypothetical protein